MTAEDLKDALEYIREWNTNAKNCHAAQAMLRAILLHHAPGDVLQVAGEQQWPCQMLYVALLKSFSNLA